MKWWLPLALMVFVVACDSVSTDQKSIRLIDEAKERGLEFIYESGATEMRQLPEIMGGGVALVDTDDDGDLDVYLVQSDTLARESATAENGLFLNDGTGYFELHDAADASAATGYGMGVSAGDVNNDGLPDLFVTHVGRNLLLVNTDNNQFTKEHSQLSFHREDWSTASTFADFDQDGDLDLWVVNYLEWSPVLEPECYQIMLGSRDYCSPSHYDAPAQDRVFRNDGGNRFTDVSNSAGILGTKGNGLGVVVADFNNDGLIDVFVANDTSVNHLWINQGNFEFIEQAAEWNCAVDQHGVARAGMGIVATDLDDDQDQDVVVVHITTEPNYVFRNENSYFRDIASSAGLNTFTQRYTRFGLVVDDLNNDGWLDLFEANGAVSRLAQPHDGDRFAEPNALYQGTASGRFEFIGYSEGFNTSRGAAVGDVNNDGLMDIVVVDRDRAVKLLMNQSDDSGNWLILDVRDEHGKAAIGAVVSLSAGDRTLTRVVQQSGSYLSSRDSRVHFGIGDASSVSNVGIDWPDGSRDTLVALQANQIKVVSQ